MTQANPRNATLSELVAEEVRALMGRKRMTGRTLAQALSVSPSWISYRLSGKQPIDLNDLALIAGALGVNPLALLPAPEIMAAAARNPNRDSGPVSRLLAPAATARQTRPAHRPSGRTSGTQRRPVSVRSPGHTMPASRAA